MAELAVNFSIETLGSLVVEEIRLLGGVSTEVQSIKSELCRKAFGPSSRGSCPSELKELSQDILAKCGGLPLAIVAVGGLLSTKNRVVSEWKKLFDRLGSILGSDPHLKDCNRVLSEGYYDLPHHLKSFLLYFGFVQYSKRPTSEQVAEEYLNELIDRSLVQVSKRNLSGRARLPVEIRNLKKLCYLMVYHYTYTTGSAVTPKTAAKVHGGFGPLRDLQKFSIIEADSQVLKELTRLRQLRKLGIRLQNGNGKDLCALIANLENLETLAVVMKSREEIFDLQSVSSPPQHLQHLHLTGNLKKLPDWIFKLKNLIRLRLKLSGLTEDPIRELRIGPCSLLMGIPIGIEHLKNLELLVFDLMVKQVYCMTKDENWEKVTKHIPDVLATFMKAGKVFCYRIENLSSLSLEYIQAIC